MQLWDDLIRDGSDVLIIGATNRPQDLDPAVQRRFERSFLIAPPDELSRREVLRKILKEVELAKTFDFALCAKLTEGYSASDLTALCKAAAAIPLTEALRQHQPTDNKMPTIRPLQTAVRKKI